MSSGQQHDAIEPLGRGIENVEHGHGIPTAGQTNSLLALTWNTVAGSRYRLQFNSDLNPTNWLDLGSSITATNDVVTTFDLLGSAPQRFYRVLLLP